MFGLKRAVTVGRRFISTSAARMEAAAPAGPKEFTEVWNKKAPSTLIVPEFPSNYTAVKAVGEGQVHGDAFPVNFYTPHSILSQAQKDTVVLPGVDGYFGVKASHVPTIAQLKPGVVELHSGAESEKFFVSGGFAFVHPNGVTDICVLEAATLDQVDPAAVKSALAAASAAQPTDEFEQAANRAAIELYSALESAVEAKA
uniref:Mitochondrial ATP synthase subunit delta n=2 Tax=Polytomella TaxID=3049 RepID=E6PBK6_9CHLO|nr:Chain R, Mitochondrial ATP synthase subunit delta [Polytomella sp. Pringsheim 198.80]6RD9_R Chain R, Mitochondrial ATP synthase subunit delta [Polytomella sp. Pringsheim 198.80]6RDB_R Chain R, Mitochondrial ATP synthase subunit delta [Polytomella sp. Pringsheim 198.80]6RDC_R Chain R, Mitochondrial ATP synthase subunit delta [Polytomella sp. Pringsheim 198.80]6RDE_R Chain R, Mitochondrial ATP synthase subunit delta [Polytomella sp. Pringsheim 198.80]6RDG_R Chain R, Mitochondrial ATP synthase|mmetsp:Transcript_11202/g.20286  ORF Transcript_11202/g.20286 Transcript_11202/m.20286 type:complete len:200 (+) Transcript_11202:139-738(+)|eukprot:CAMPEP_0175055774 /NCGR_PEP_ID=MMETSP0052_2-20121109/10277_1 /TAXON_ID=51329 ORGANISM="Polytomella parva, Strain SAG 63-3" /NCGR_SAMPLE_ID=MMETSP0052_2 /ASSEMBLY_ACC=CAM_ASM_000194 /LENGTH=199 /DNA_ID=CAMNT_0016320677 /DNA_START=99 /DNA_END=698 /DNA_ORIENTATION=-